MVYIRFYFFVLVKIISVQYLLTTSRSSCRHFFKSKVVEETVLL